MFNDPITSLLFTCYSSIKYLPIGYGNPISVWQLSINMSSFGVHYMPSVPLLEFYINANVAGAHALVLQKTNGTCCSFPIFIECSIIR